MNILRWMWTWGVPVWGFQKLLELFQLLSVCVHLDKYKMKCREPLMSGKKAGSICKPTLNTVKKRWRVSCQQPGCHYSLTKLFLVGESLVSDIPPGDGKQGNLFSKCTSTVHKPPSYTPVLAPEDTSMLTNILSPCKPPTLQYTRTCTKMNPHTCTGTMQSCRPPLHYPLLVLGRKFVLVNPIQLLKSLYPSASVTLIMWTKERIFFLYSGWIWWTSWDECGPEEFLSEDFRNCWCSVPIGLIFYRERAS
jgi:hypothetical protein